MYEHILLTTDGSELAARGIEHGLALARSVGARVTVLTVTEPLDQRDSLVTLASGGRLASTHYDQATDELIKERFADASERAARHGVEIALKQETDEHPAEAIVRTAKTLGCELIVMASHGRRGARRLILGSQTAEVVTDTTIPVLVVR